MIRSSLVVTGGVVLVGASPEYVVSVERQRSGDSKPPVVSAASQAFQGAMLNRFCVTYYNKKLKTAGLMLDKMAAGNVG
jgi:hypothetical protein